MLNRRPPASILNPPLSAPDARLAGPDTAHVISPKIVEGSVRLIELILGVVSPFAIAALYLQEAEVVANVHYLTAILVQSLAMVTIFGVSGLYSVRDLASPVGALPRLALGWASSFAIVGTAIFFLKLGVELSRVWLFTWFFVGAALLTSGRFLAARVISAWSREGRLYRRAVIYGAGTLTAELVRQLEANAGSDVRVVGIFDERSAERTRASGFQDVGSIDECLAVSRKQGVDLVILALPVASEKRIALVANRLSVLPADIKLPAMATEIPLARRLFSHIGSVAMIDLYDKPIADWDFVTKSIFDRVFAAIALVLLLPLMVLVAIAIKLESRGPVIFRQKRYGFNNELIEVLKFRSMYVEACDAWASKLVSRGDPRVTRVGRFIRRTSIDELPQLVNVLFGDLSLVGPRPHAVAAKAADHLYDEVVSHYFARHKVKPGITGWAQVNGWRGETDTREKLERRIEHDLYYIDNWSVLFDLVILARTPFALIKGDGAY